MTDIIRKISIVNSIIKETLYECEDGPVTYPRILKYCPELGQPTFTITIDKDEEKYFIDAKGRKWYRAD
jgi:hypothetical protein